MNSAYIKMQKEHAKRERRSDLMAVIFGSIILVGGAFIGATMLYLFTFTVLSLGV